MCFLFESLEILIGPKNYSLNFRLMKIASYGQHPIDSLCYPSDGNLGQKKRNDTIFVQYIQKNQGHSWTLCLNEHNFFSPFQGRNTLQQYTTTAFKGNGRATRRHKKLICCVKYVKLSWHAGSSQFMN